MHSYNAYEVTLELQLRTEVVTKLTTHMFGSAVAK